LAGASAGVIVLIANAFFPLQRPLFDPANLLYLLGTTGTMPLLGFVADAVWTERQERTRTRNIFGKYVSESIAQRALDAQTGAPLSGETRIATVLISDIRGFTRMLQELGAEQVVHTLNEYFTRMIDVIGQYEGTVNKFIGDAIVVLYNAPLDQPDATARALATARAMHNAVQEMNVVRIQEELPPIHIGIAIDGGEVVCGNVGSPKRLEYTAIGAPVNTAYHLASLAPAGTIYITEHVYRALNQAVPATLAEEVELKGGTGRLSVYALDKPA
jgi:adenylate cyclase